MTSSSTIPLVDAIAATETEATPAASQDALRAQAALVRALVDELEHYRPWENRISALHAQLGEELSRLTDLAPAGAAVERSSATEATIDVLIVEDEPSTLGAMALAVGELGYPCRKALNAEDALREYERRPAAIVVSDWHMPGMNGLDLARALKNRSPHTYVILVTAFPDEAQVAVGIRHGVDDLLSKPIEIDQLAVRLRGAERIVRAIRTLERVKQMRG